MKRCRITCTLWLSLAASMTAGLAQSNNVTTSGGTTGTLPVFTGSATIGNSAMTQSGNYIGIGTGTSSPVTTLTVLGSILAGNKNGIGTEAGSSTNYLGVVNNSINSSASIVLGELDGTYNPRALIIQSASPTSNLVTFTGGYTNSSGYPNWVFMNGNVGIGTTNPSALLEVNGNVKLTSGSGASITYSDGTQQTTAWTGVVCGGDYAEDVETDGNKSGYEPGDVLVIAADSAKDVQKSQEAYSTSVAGIYATKPGVIGKRESMAKVSDDIPMAMVGIVPTKVTAENGPIHRGDLLVSSSRLGYAMKGTDRGRMLGAVIGKAMGTLEIGTGTIEVLVTLQ